MYDLVEESSKLSEHDIILSAIMHSETWLRVDRILFEYLLWLFEAEDRLCRSIILSKLSKTDPAKVTPTIAKMASTHFSYRIYPCIMRTRVFGQEISGKN